MAPLNRILCIRMDVFEIDSADWLKDCHANGSGCLELFATTGVATILWSPRLIVLLTPGLRGSHMERVPIDEDYCSSDHEPSRLASVI